MTVVFSFTPAHCCVSFCLAIWIPSSLKHFLIMLSLDIRHFEILHERHCMKWIELNFLSKSGFQHLSLAKSAEFLAPMPGCNGHALQLSYELEFFLGKIKWQCQYLESKQRTDQYFHLWWGWQNENVWRIFERFNAHSEITLFCCVYLHLVLVLNVHAGGICMCMSGKKRGREGGNSRAWN